MKYWFTSDLHLGHANIIKYCGRTIFMTRKDKKLYDKVKNLNQEEQRKFIISFESLNRMNKGIIKRWNERVKPEDMIFVIGDFCFRNSSEKRGEGIRRKSADWQKMLNGYKVFIKGNHDKNNSTKTIIERLVIGYGNKRINLVHDPEFADVNYLLNLTGHVHNNWKIKRIKKGWQFTDCFNVGVDRHNFYPITFNEIMKQYIRWKKENKYV